MDYYWISESSEKLRELIDADSIENGKYSLLLTATYTKNGKAFTSELTPIKVDEFTKYYSNTLRKCIPDISTASNIIVTLVKKNISSGIEKYITIYNSPVMSGKKI